MVIGIFECQNMSAKIPIQAPARAAVMAASAATATLLGALYLDQRYGLSYDIQQLLREKAFRNRLQERIRSLGDDVSLYHMLELAEPTAEALWFEGRRWTYAEVLQGWSRTSRRTEIHEAYRWAETDRLAAFLANLRVSPGDSVAIFATNTPEMVFAITATTKLGAVPALVNAALRGELAGRFWSYFSVSFCQSALRHHPKAY